MEHKTAKVDETDGLTKPLLMADVLVELNSCCRHHHCPTTQYACQKDRACLQNRDW